MIALSQEPADWLVGPEAERLWVRLGEVDLSIGLLIDPVQLPLVHDLAQRPGLRIVIDHLGRIGAAAWPAWGPVLLTSSRLPNVYVKLSALGQLSEHSFPFPDLHEPVRELVDSFDPRAALGKRLATRLWLRQR